jgi:hypothetical protein
MLKTLARKFNNRARLTVVSNDIPQKKILWLPQPLSETS